MHVFVSFSVYKLFRKEKRPIYRRYVLRPFVSNYKMFWIFFPSKKIRLEIQLGNDLFQRKPSQLSAESYTRRVRPQPKLPNHPLRFLSPSSSAPLPLKPWPPPPPDAESMRTPAPDSDPAARGCPSPTSSTGDCPQSTADTICLPRFCPITMLFGGIQDGFLESQPS